MLTPTVLLCTPGEISKTDIRDQVKEGKGKVVTKLQNRSKDLILGHDYDDDNKHYNYDDGDTEYDDDKDHLDM